MKISPITRMLIEAMSAIGEGDVLTYTELGEIAKYPCRPGEQGYAYVQTAIKRMEHDGINFANVVDIGYRRLTPGEALEQIREQQFLTGKRASRHETKAVNLEYDRLTHAQRVEQATTLITAKLGKRIYSLRTREKMISHFKDKPEPVKAIDWDRLESLYLRGRKNDSQA